MIDRHIKAPWPPEVAEALAHFRQGDLIERPPFFYGRHATIEIFDAGGPAEEESQVHEVHPDDAPPYGIITTQTCDINEQGTPTQPWIQVSPVWAQLWRLGLQIEEGTRLKPVAVRLHVLSMGQPSDQVLGWFADWEDATRVEAEAVGITLLTTRHHDATNMDAQLADRLVPLAI